jgi:hypothetical protein
MKGKTLPDYAAGLSRNMIPPFGSAGNRFSSGVF